MQRACLGSAAHSSNTYLSQNSIVPFDLSGNIPFKCVNCQSIVHRDFHRTYGLQAMSASNSGMNSLPQGVHAMPQASRQNLMSMHHALYLYPSGVTSCACTIHSTCTHQVCPLGLARPQQPSHVPVYPVRDALISRSQNVDQLRHSCFAMPGRPALQHAHTVPDISIIGKNSCFFHPST